MWIARFLLFFLAQAIGSGLFDRFQEFLATRTAARQQGFFLFAKEKGGASGTATGSSSSPGSPSTAHAVLSSLFFGHPHAVVHALNEESFMSQVAKSTTGAPWLLHLYSPYDEAAKALNLLLDEEVAPIVYLSSAMTTEDPGIKLHIGKIDVVAHPHLAASLGYFDGLEEEDELGPHRSLLKVVRASPSPSSSSHQQQQQQQEEAQRSQPPALPSTATAPPAVAALARRLVVEEYHGRRTRQALLELAEHAGSPFSFFSSLFALPTPARVRTLAELDELMAEHPFLFVLAEGDEEREEQASLEAVVRLAFVSTCEARMWRHCALVDSHVLLEAYGGDQPFPQPFVAKLEQGGGDIAAPLAFPLDPAAFAVRPAALREWMLAQNCPLVAPMPLALEGPAFERLILKGRGRLVVARVGGGSSSTSSTSEADASESEEEAGDRALIEALHALAHGKGDAGRAWLRSSRVRLGYVVEGAPRSQLPLGSAAGEGLASTSAASSAGLGPLFLVDGPTRGVYAVSGPEALEGVVRGVVEGRLAVPTFRLAGKGNSALGPYPHVAKLLGQLEALIVAALAALGLALVLAFVVLFSPRQWWIRDGQGSAAEEQGEREKAKARQSPARQSPARQSPARQSPARHLQQVRGSSPVRVKLEYPERQGRVTGAGALWATKEE